MQISPLPARKTYNCYSGCVTLILERQGEIYSEPMAFGLSRAINVEFTVDDGIHYKSIRLLHCLTDFLESRGLKVDRVVDESPAGLEAAVAANIKANLPTMVEYDGYFLDFTQIYRVKHERRIGLIVGMDDGAFYVSDPIYGVQSVCVDRAEFHDTRDSRGGATVEPARYVVKMDKTGLPPVGSTDARDAIAETASHVLTAQGPLRGVKCLKKFGALLPQIRDEIMKPDVADKLSEELKQGGLTYNHYGEFLRLVSVPGCQFGDASERMDRIANRYRTAAALIWKTGWAGSDKYLGRIAEIFGEAGEEMEAAFLGIRQQVGIRELT